MNEFDFRNKYIDMDEQEEEIDEDKLNEIMSLNLEDDFEDPQEPKKEKKHHDDESSRERKPISKKSLKTIGLIVVVVTISCLVVAGYIWYSTAEGPVAASVHIESDNFDDPREAYYGNQITLSFSFNKELSKEPVVIINKNKVEVSGEGKDYYAKYFVQYQDTQDVVVEFSINDYKDKLGKTGKPITQTTDNSSVTIPAFK